ncbi:DNA-3-methyladenine glycosylase [Klenkia sp. PcliD-1-E]|uniref:DNA-3-methyladenine glycosylase n=1 Tax=Klenkia sp. PcliD-1-E TaxID=2954492 RepID=UPI002097C7F7|nr:DNA-3-methyladenine glycosylase [Klenkia sp. PcliD-1-E]MCO7221404.1 DNA-3-methyladenine glycosylase [Klenkia sp. PcliD-1-E]
MPGPLVSADELLARPEVVAPALLGCWLVTDRPEGTTAVRLTEVEAYSGAGDDPAAHSHRGPTPRSSVMFGPPGRLYVYFSYGMHWCANVVTGPAGVGSAVLLRAGEVVVGEQLALGRRPSSSVRDLARGPARLTAALGIGADDRDADLLDPGSPVRLHHGTPPDGVTAGPRVGITHAADLPWRFTETGHRTVSAFRAGVRRRRPGAGQDGAP